MMVRRTGYLLAAILPLVALGACQKRVTVILENTSDAPLDVSVQKLGEMQALPVGLAEPGEKVQYLIVEEHSDLPRTYEFVWQVLGEGSSQKQTKALMIRKSTRAPIVIELPLGQVK
ncbi:MAG: hypothetical protein ACLFUJ_02910 [Phycisphaerae bacterium]